jgi:hypothetical protein
MGPFVNYKLMKPSGLFTKLYFLLCNIQIGTNRLGLEILAIDKHFSLLDPFVIYNENEVLRKWPRILFTTLQFLHN